jgi:4'-phosphopantetheinyl transferase
MPNPIYWMLVDSQQTVLEAAQALSPFELQKYAAFRFPKRRDEWLLGRWTAKALAHSLPAYRHYSLAQIEIRNALQGSPYIQLPGRATPAECLTISHSGNLALCALSTSLELQIGADLERIEARTETFILDYFTPTERQLVDRASAETRAELVTLIWSIKESMLKALGTGLHRDTRSVEVLGLDGGQPSGDGHSKWQSLQIGEQPAGERVWAAWWQHRPPFILTLAGCAATQQPIRSVQLLEQQVGG